MGYRLCVWGGVLPVIGQCDIDCVWGGGGVLVLVKGQCDIDCVWGRGGGGGYYQYWGSGV